MISMILRMSGVTLSYVLLTILIWKWRSRREMTWPARLLIGLVYGLCAVMSTHFAIDYGDMLLNVRDIGPLAAGLFFDPVSGIIAGLIGGIERYIAGTYWGIGSYTRIACSVSTCLAGFLAALAHVRLFKRKKPSEVYAFFMGAVMEVFHMYVVFITHRGDMKMALHVVKTCAPPMIIFTGIGMALSSMAIRALSGEMHLHRYQQEEVPVSVRFQRWLFAVTFVVMLVNFQTSFSLQTETATQEARSDLAQISGDVRSRLTETGGWDDIETARRLMKEIRVGSNGTADLLNDRGTVMAGPNRWMNLVKPLSWYLEETETNGSFQDKVFGKNVMGRAETTEDGRVLMLMMPMDEIYASRDEQAYETALADILLFAVIYVMISILVQQIVVRNLAMVNESLGKITGGDLNEVVNVRSSSEFASLSDDINQTVDVLKGYIDAAEKRIEQELEFAKTIQASALPTNFNFPRRDFEVYASMDPAKEVGGDFYDFFLVGQNKLVLTIADVSGKGIPAALFMMRAKTALRGYADSGQGPAEILARVNGTLCEGNEAEMFVTVWTGIADLETGIVRCASAGHEYPMLMRAGETFELMKDKHGPPLATIEGLKYREYEIEMKPGDRLFVYTDGIPEAINTQVEQYGTDRLLKALDREKDVPMRELLPAIRADLSAFTGDADQFDDITMLGFTYFGPEREKA